MAFRKKKTLLDRAGEIADSALSHLEDAIESAKPMVESARESAAPRLAEGREIAKEKAAAAAALAAEKAHVGKEIAAEKAASGRALAAARVAEARGVEPEPKGGRLKKFLLLLGLAGIGAVVFKKMKADQASDNWQSSYVPTPPPAPAADLGVEVNADETPIAAEAAEAVTAEAGEPVTDDPAGAGPDEAAADNLDEAHETTTPDDPAEVVEVDSKQK